MRSIANAHSSNHQTTTERHVWLHANIACKKHKSAKER